MLNNILILWNILMCFFLVTTAQYSWKNKIKTFFPAVFSKLNKAPQILYSFQFQLWLHKTKVQYFFRGTIQYSCKFI